jgi:hypothetical protein
MQLKRKYVNKPAYQKLFQRQWITKSSVKHVNSWRQVKHIRAV